MPDVVIKVENLSKRYLVGHRGREGESYKALRDVIVRSMHKFARNAADFFAGRQIIQGDEVEDFWALRDVNFEVKRGEVLGVIGSNGAGKTTLLKVLSRITEPSTGRVTIGGRVSSLLEVGTGFHPELSGRENIYLNGAILGMTHAEVRRKFDEIVTFSGVQKFIDTPVKYYSSGMYVRLAFAVAAHLETEILLVDEVLAVGDAEFQKRCLGRIREVAGSGRTVLFVSHSMAAVQALCSRSLLLQDGRISVDGDVTKVISTYSERYDHGAFVDLSRIRRIGKQQVTFKRISIFDRSGQPIASPATGDCATFRIEFEGSIHLAREARIGITFQTITGIELFICANEASSHNSIFVGANSIVECTIPRFPLTKGSYGVSLFLERNGEIQDWLQEPVYLEVQDRSFFGTARNVPLGWEGKSVLVSNTWKMVKCSEMSVQES